MHVGAGSDSGSSNGIGVEQSSSRTEALEVLVVPRSSSSSSSTLKPKAIFPKLLNLAAILSEDLRSGIESFEPSIQSWGVGGTLAFMGDRIREPQPPTSPLSLGLLNLELNLSLLSPKALRSTRGVWPS